MPREIDCPYSPKTIAGIKYCTNCKDGKIKVYTEAEFRELERKYREAVKALIKINKSVIEHRTEDGYQDVILVMEGIEIENMLERQTGKSWEELQEE